MILGNFHRERTITLNIPESHFHKNSIRCAELISNSLQRTLNQTGVYLLYGTSGTGKTRTGLYLVNLLDKICQVHSYINEENDFFIDNFHMAHDHSNVKDVGYYILVVDEVDEMLERIFKNTKSISGEKDEDNSSIKNLKQRWNNFMDYIHYVNNVVIILTTNKTKNSFDEMDDSLFREHRITCVYEFTNENVSMI